MYCKNYVEIHRIEEALRPAFLLLFCPFGFRSHFMWGEIHG